MSEIFSFAAIAANLLVTFAAAIAFFDATRRPAQAFEVIGRGSKIAWLVGLGAGTFIVFWFGMFSLLGLISTIAIIVYHVDQKPKLNEVMRPRY